MSYIKYSIACVALLLGNGLFCADEEPQKGGKKIVSVIEPFETATEKGYKATYISGGKEIATRYTSGRKKGWAKYVATSGLADNPVKRSIKERIDYLRDRYNATGGKIFEDQ